MESPKKALGMSGGSLLAFGGGVYLGYQSPGIEKIEAWAGNKGWGMTGLGVAYFALAIGVYYLKKYVGIGGTGVVDLIFNFLIGFLVGLGAGVFRPGE
jgi:hypothetical protein